MIFTHQCRLIFGTILLCGIANTGAMAESLLDAYELAKAHDPQLKANNAALRAAFSDATILRSGILPRITASANYTEDDGRQTSRSPLSQIYGLDANETTRFDTEARSDSYALTLRQSIFSLPAIYDARRASNIRKRSVALLAEEQQTLILRVADAYFAVLRNSESLLAAKHTEEAIAKQNNLTLNRFESGLTQAVDFLETQVNYDTSVANRINQEALYYTAHQDLRTLTGGNSKALWSLREDFPVTPPQPTDAETWVKRAITNNYRIRAAELALQSAKNALAAKRSAHLPSISASLTQNKSDSRSSSFNSVSNDERDVQSVAISMEIPLFLGGQLHAERRRAYQEHVQAKAVLTQTRNDVMRQVRAIHHRLITHVTRIQALAQAHKSAERALSSIKNGYETGTRDILDVLNAERALYQTLRDYNHSRMDYLADTLRLKGQIGALGERDIHSINNHLENDGRAIHLPHVLPEGSNIP